MLLLVLLFMSALPSKNIVPETDTTVAIRAMSFNIRFANPDDGIDYWPIRKHRVAGLIRHHEPAIAGLQEVLHSQLVELDSALPKMAWIGAGRDDGLKAGEFSPILYRTDLLELEDAGVFWLSEAPADTGSVGWDAALPRIVTWGRFRVKTDDTIFLFYNTHFDHRGRLAREASARLIIRRIREEAGDLPVILVGDFNAIPFSNVYPELTEPDYHGQIAMEDAYLSAETGPVGSEGTCCGFDARDENNQRRIDYIFTANGVRTRYFATIDDQWNGRYPSDHRPVIADLQLAPN